MTENHQSSEVKNQEIVIKEILTKLGPFWLNGIMGPLSMAENLMGFTGVIPLYKLYPKTSS